jgi:hypothetical protein
VLAKGEDDGEVTGGVDVVALHESIEGEDGFFFGVEGKDFWEEAGDIRGSATGHGEECLGADVDQANVLDFDAILGGVEVLHEALHGFGFKVIPLFPVNELDFFCWGVG